MQEQLIATDYYPEYTHFNDPWDYGIVDNFLDQNIIDQILKIGEDRSLYRFIDGRNQQDGTVANKSSIVLVEYKEILESVTNSVNKHIENLLPKPSYCVPDLVCCDPKYKYVKHRDHPNKLLSIIVYLAPEEGNGTLVWGEDDKPLEIMWKPNRAVIFENSKHGIHNYINKTNHLRYTLNIYITDNPKTSFGTKRIPKPN